MVESIFHRILGHKCYIPKRYVFSLLGFAACTLVVNFCTNLSIVIVSMVNRNETVTSVRNSNECLAEQILLENGTDEAVYDPRRKPGDFFWSPETEGLAIGAPYYGQFVGFMPGGRMAELFGGKRVLIGSILLASFLTFLLPVTAFWSVYAFIACRFFIGVVTAAAIPVLFYLIAKWIPTTERSLHASVILAGYGVGSFAGFITGGTLSGIDFLGGWPSVFYIGGLTGCIWCLLFHFFSSESPLEHPSISSEELDYILKNVPTNEGNKIADIPWKKMALSVPLWSLCIAYFGQFWILGFFFTAHPLYMGTILNLDIVQNGQLSCLPHLIRALFACICGFPADYLLKRKYVTVGFIRKGATTLNTVVSCAGFIGILLAGCDPVINTIFFTIGGLLGDFVTFGVCMACIDIAPDLSGTVSGIVNIVGAVPFFLIPAIIGWVTKYERNMTQWSYVYYCTIAVAVVTNIFYLAFGTSEPQPWGLCVTEEQSASRVKDDETAENRLNEDNPVLHM